MNAQAFYKPEPKEPWSDWRTYSMLIPILSGALGACIFLALGFSFTEMASIPQRARTVLVIAASFAVAFGSTFGSIGSGIEIFRKAYIKQAKPWDWVSLCISTATTIAGFAMGFAALLGATAEWSAVAQVYGSLVVGTLAALDCSGDMIELGGLFGSHEMRVEVWREERMTWNLSQTSEQEADIALLLPFVCEDCGRAFDSQQGLNGHGKAHTGERSNGHHKEPVIAGREVN